MSKLLANAAVALSLMLGASVSAPAWAGKIHDQKCPAAKHKHVKRVALDAKKRPSGGGVMLFDQRKQDVQILSFGP